jgi:hypothetical protein
LSHRTELAFEPPLGMELEVTLRRVAGDANASADRAAAAEGALRGARRGRRGGGGRGGGRLLCLAVARRPTPRHRVHTPISIAHLTVSISTCCHTSTLLCEAIARRLFPNGSSPELAADLEVFISARVWEMVVYTRVASVAMKNYKELFLKHDADCFNAYLADVSLGRSGLPRADLQWQRMVTTCARSAS